MTDLPAGDILQLLDALREFVLTKRRAVLMEVAGLEKLLEKLKALD